MKFLLKRVGVEIRSDFLIMKTAVFVCVLLAIAATCVYGAEVKAEVSGPVIPQLVDSLDLGALKPVPKRFRVKPIILIAPGKHAPPCLAAGRDRYHPERHVLFLGWWEGLQQRLGRGVV